MANFRWEQSVAGSGGVLLTFECELELNKRAEYRDQWNRIWTAFRGRGRLTFKMNAGEKPKVLNEDGTYTEV